VRGGGPVRRDQGGCFGTLGVRDRRRRQCLAAQDPAEHPPDVGVEDDGSPPERERRDRSGGVLADPRE